MSVTWALLLHSVGPIICLLHPRWYCREAGGTVVGSIMGKFRGDSLGTSFYKGPSFLYCIVAKMTARHTASFTFSQCVFPLGPSVLFLEMDWTFFSFHRRSSTLDPRPSNNSSFLPFLGLLQRIGMSEHGLGRPHSLGPLGDEGEGSSRGCSRHITAAASKCGVKLDEEGKVEEKDDEDEEKREGYVEFGEGGGSGSRSSQPRERRGEETEERGLPLLQ